MNLELPEQAGLPGMVRYIVEWFYDVGQDPRWIIEIAPLYLDEAIFEATRRNKDHVKGTLWRIRMISNEQ